MNNFIKRALIFQFPLVFAYYKYSNFFKNAIDFQKRIVYLLKISGLSNEVINNYSPKIISLFPFFLGACALFSILAILNLKCFNYYLDLLVFISL